MFEDLVKGVREYISDRFISPLGASILISWLAWNYKFILVVLSSESAIRKIHLISLIYQDSGYSILHLLLGPLLTSAFYIFIFPYPSQFVYKFALERRKDALDAQRSIEGRTPLTQEESQALRKEFFRMEADFDAERKGLQTKLDSLKEQLQIAIESRDSISEELRSLQAADPSMGKAAKREEHKSSRIGGLELNEIPRNILRVLIRMSGATPEEVAREMSLPAEVVFVALKELEGFQLVEIVEMSVDGAWKRKAIATDEGVRYYIRYLA